VSHQYALSGRPEPIPFVGTWGGLGVLVFFAISGYLVAASWHHDPSAPRFVARRLLRIWPRAGGRLPADRPWCSGPLVSAEGVRDYFSSPVTLDYLQLLGLWEFKSQLPGIFSANPVPGKRQRLAVDAADRGAVLYRPRPAGAARAVSQHGRGCWPCSLSAATVFFFVPTIGYDNPLRAQLQMAMVFFAAACLYQVRRHLADRKALVGCDRRRSSLVGLWHVGLYELAFTLGLPLAVILWGTAATPWCGAFGRFGDVSYGLYIYAYPSSRR
jgi:hypothetical protein